MILTFHLKRLNVRMNLKFSVKKNNQICLSSFLIERAINKVFSFTCYSGRQIKDAQIG